MSFRGGRNHGRRAQAGSALGAVRKGKKNKPKAAKAKADPNHRTRPQLAVELISLVAAWFPNDEIVVTGDSAYGGKSVLSHLPVTGHLFLRFSKRRWYERKSEPSFADLLTTLRRVSYEEKTEQLQPKPSRLKTWLTQITELLSRTG